MRWFIAACLALAGCQGSGIASVGVVSSKTTLQPGQSATLTASIIGTGDFSTEVTWSVDGGGPGLTSSGLVATYTAPLVGAPTTVVIRATSIQDASKYGTAAIAISTALGIQVSANPTQLQAGQTSTLTATPGAGVPGVIWSIEGSGPGAIAPPTGNTAVYTAPASVPAAMTVVVRASSTSDPLVFGSAAIELVPITVTITLTPNATRLYSGQVIGLNGTVFGPPGGDPGVTWSIFSGGGSISASSGSDIQFTAPAVSSEQTVIIRASPVADPAQHTDLALTIDHGWPAEIVSGDGQDTARGVAVDAQSFAVYVAGETDGHFDVSSFGSVDGFVAKLDRYGNLAWVRQFGTDLSEDVSGVVADMNGNVYVGGQTNGIGFVIAYDRDGNFKWRRDFGPVSLEYTCRVSGLALDQNQLVYAAGHCLTKLGFVQRCDASGCDGPAGRLTVVLPSRAPDPDLPVPRFVAISVDVFGNYDLVGRVSPGGGVGDTGFITQVRPNNCASGANCVPEWATTVKADNPADSVNLVTVTTDGINVYAGGFTNGTVDGGPSLGGEDAVLLAVDRIGTTAPLWSRQFGTGSDDRVTGLAYDILFTQQLYPTGSIDSPADAFLAFYTASGSSVSPMVTFEEPGTTDIGGGVAIADAHGNLIVTFTTGSDFGGPPSAFLHVGVRKTDGYGNPLSL